MQTKINASSTYNIPICYQCSKCGAQVRAFIPVVGIGSAFKQGYAGDNAKEELQSAANADAHKMLGAFIQKHYEKDAIYHYTDIIGKCPACGSMEKWQKDPKKAARRQKLLNILPVFIAWIMIIVPFAVGVVYESFSAGLLAFLAAVVLFVAGIVILNNVLEKRGDPAAYMDALSVPESSRPKYELTLTEILEQIDMKC